MSSKRVYTFLPPDQGPNAPPQVYGSKKRAVVAALEYGCHRAGEVETAKAVFDLERFGRVVVEKPGVLPPITIHRVTLR